MKKINNNLPRGGAEWGRALRRFLSDNIVPIMFVLICAYCIPRADLSWNYLLNEGMTRLGRNAFLILSLLIPVMAGMGMNFGMTLGAMAGQIGLIFAADWQVWGIPGLILAAIISIPISVLLGIMIGKLLNRAKGREMITSYMIAFAMDGVYQFFVLFMMGPVIPIIHNTLKLPRGYGIRNTVSLLNMRQSLDNLLAVSVGGVKIPVLTLIIIAAACLFILWFRRTKLGQDMRAVGQDMEVARDAGIKVERVIIRTMVLSGAVCGLMGLLLTAGTDHTLTTTIVDSRGFTAVMVSWMSKFNPFIMIAASLLLVTMDRGASEVSSSLGLNHSFADILTGFILFFIIATEFFITYKVTLRKSSKKEA